MDIEASAQEALAAVDPVPFYVAAGQNAWARVKAHFSAALPCGGAITGLELGVYVADVRVDGVHRAG